MGIHQKKKRNGTKDFPVIKDGTGKNNKRKQLNFIYTYFILLHSSFNFPVKKPNVLNITDQGQEQQ